MFYGHITKVIEAISIFIKHNDVHEMKKKNKHTHSTCTQENGCGKNGEKSSNVIPANGHKRNHKFVLLSRFYLTRAALATYVLWLAEKKVRFLESHD